MEVVLFHSNSWFTRINCLNHLFDRVEKRNTTGKCLFFITYLQSYKTEYFMIHNTPELEHNYGLFFELHVLLVVVIQLFSWNKHMNRNSVMLLLTWKITLILIQSFIQYKYIRVHAPLLRLEELIRYPADANLS